MSQSSPQSYGIKTQLSLASLMFFGPFIKHFLGDESSLELNQEDKSFVKGYMVLGIINIGLAAICITLGVLSTFFALAWVEVLFLVFSSVLLLSLIGGSIGIFANIPLGQQKNTNLTQSMVIDLDISQNGIRDYLPFVNIYLWYHTHDFEGKHPIIKESLLIRSLFGLLCLIGNIWIVGIALIIITLRIVSLVVIGDSLPQGRHDGIDKLFHKNNEEVWGFILAYLLRSLKVIFGSKSLLSNVITEQQMAYSYLYDLKKYGAIQWQYVLLLLGSGYFVYITSNSIGFGFILLGVLMLLGRYIMMAIAWGHLPPVPIINDIFRGIQNLFNHKRSITNK